MTTRGLKQLLDHLQQALVSDGQLLLRFVAAQDEDAFAALLQRHGPMVFGVCRRVLRHAEDAEDAFQATFLVLARQAGSVVRRECVGTWLFQVAYRTALRARAANLRRRERERQVQDMPHPATGPVEPQDWPPLLDRELNRLPWKYREAAVLCDLEGKSRRQAARQLGIPEGTLSGRLTAARRLLAQRLSRYGLTVSGGALAAALSAEASAAVPAALVVSTARAALLVGAGQLAAISPPAALLMKGVLKAMFVQKLKVIGAVVLVALAFGTGSLAYQAAEPVGPRQAQPQGGKPASELEALRRENELLRLNLLVLLEKIRAQEDKLAVKTVSEERALREKREADLADLMRAKRVELEKWKDAAKPPDPVLEAEAALKALRSAPDPEAKQRAAEALEEAVKKLRGHKDTERPK